MSGLVARLSVVARRGGEGMIGFLDDARRRFLKPSARILPPGVDPHVVSSRQLENDAVAQFGSRCADPQDASEIVRSTAETLGRLIVDQRGPPEAARISTNHERCDAHDTPIH